MTDECRPAAGAESAERHWLNHPRWGWALGWWLPLSGDWRIQAICGNIVATSREAAELNWTYHAPASPDDATERARLEREVKMLQGQIDAQAKPVAGDPVFMVLHELQQENIRLRGSLERIARFDHKNAVPWTHQAAADAYWLALDGCRLIARAALTPGDAS